MFHEEAEDVNQVSHYKSKLDPYINFLISQYAIENQYGWDAPVKAKSRIRQKPRRTFADPSLPAALLNLSPDRLMHDMQMFGNLFEELCLHDVRAYADALDPVIEPKIYYYADHEGLEVDIIVELSDGRWGAFEVKLSEAKIPKAESALLRLAAKIANNPAAQNPEPAFLAVLVGNARAAITLQSGVHVVPLTCLGV